MSAREPQTTAIGMALNIAWAAARGQVDRKENTGWQAVVAEADRELAEIRRAQDATNE